MELRAELGGTERAHGTPVSGSCTRDRRARRRPHLMRTETMVRPSAETSKAGNERNWETHGSAPAPRADVKSWRNCSGPRHRGGGGSRAARRCRARALDPVLRVPVRATPHRRRGSRVERERQTNWSPGLDVDLPAGVRQREDFGIHAGRELPDESAGSAAEQHEGEEGGHGDRRGFYEGPVIPAGVHALGWRRRPDLNRGITDLQSVALATWLRRRRARKDTRGGGPGQAVGGEASAAATVDASRVRSGEVAESEDASDLKSEAARHPGSTPGFPTRLAATWRVRRRALLPRFEPDHEEPSRSPSRSA